MNRRFALMSLSGALAVPLLTELAFAQSTKLPTLDHSQYKTDTLMLGTLSKQASLLARERSRNAKVKEFAQFEIDEQVTMARVLTNEANPPPAALDAGHAEVLARLQRASDKEFDMTYVQNELTTHAELLSTQQSFLNIDPSDMDFRHIAMLARTVIEMHVTMLHDLQAMLTA